MRKYIFVAKHCFLTGARFLLSFLGAQRCVVCGSPCRIIPVCVSCSETYFLPAPLFSRTCRVCGRMLVSENGVCTECRRSPVLQSTDGVFPLFSYRLWNVDVLCRWKLHEERQLSSFFAEKIAVRLAEVLRTFPGAVIVPVPPRPGKIQREGWDQIQELSEFLEFEYDFPVMRILKRNSSAEQKKLDRTGRLAAVGKSYSLQPGIFAVPETVCLLDDVVTTGSTLESCAVALKTGGAKTVFAVTLFSVDS